MGSGRSRRSRGRSDSVGRPGRRPVMGDMEIPDELIDQLLGEYRGPEQLTGPEGLINELRRRLIERAAGAELEQHLGYPPGAEPPEAQPNRRNGISSKTLRTVDGPVTVELPRDRDASFEPRIVPKHARSFDGFDEQILALYAGGMTTREIAASARAVRRRRLRRADQRGDGVDPRRRARLAGSAARGAVRRRLPGRDAGRDPRPAGRQEEGGLRRDRGHARGRA